MQVEVKKDVFFFFWESFFTCFFLWDRFFGRWEGELLNFLQICYGISSFMQLWLATGFSRRIRSVEPNVFLVNGMSRRHRTYLPPSVVTRKSGNPHAIWVKSTPGEIIFIVHADGGILDFFQGRGYESFRIFKLSPSSRRDPKSVEGILNQWDPFLSMNPKKHSPLRHGTPLSDASFFKTEQKPIGTQRSLENVLQPRYLLRLRLFCMQLGIKLVNFSNQPFSWFSKNSRQFTLPETKVAPKK